MTRPARTKGQAQIVIGMGALATAVVMLAKLQNDFLSGLSFGIAIGVLLLGIYTLTRSKAS